MEKTQQTSADRLLRILGRAKKEDAGQLTSKVWTDVLGCDPSLDNKPEDFSRKYAELCRLKDTVLHDLESLDGLDEEVHLGWKLPVTNLLFLDRLHKKWGDVSVQLDENVLLSLRAAAFELRREGKNVQTDLDASELDTLRTQARDLLSEIVESDLPEEVRRACTEILAPLIHALDVYSISGADAMREALQRAFGATFFVERELWEVHKGIFEKICHYVDEFNRLAVSADIVVATVAQIAERASQVIGFLAPPR